MSTLLNALSAPLFQAVGWALVNFVWQGLLLAVVFRAILGAMHRAPAQARYLVGCAGLLLMAAAPVAGTVTALRTAPETAAVAQGAADGAAAEFVPAADAGRADAAVFSAAPSGEVAGWMEQWRDGVRRWLPLVVLGWMLGVLLGSVRMAGAWVHLRRLRTRWLCEVPEPWRASLSRLAGELRISRPVRLLVSTRIDGPALVGALSPVILLPASLLTGLSVRDLELILAHELAHVRRWDYAVNLAQAALETVLFFHPAVWWLSGVVREEREHCCDDAVVAATGRGNRYARALLAAEELRAARPGPMLAPALGGGSLYRRVQRLVGPGQGPPAAGAGSLAALGVLLCAVLALGGVRTLTAGEGSVASLAAVVDDARPSDPGALGERRRQARQRAAAEGWSRGYWIGWAVPGDHSVDLASNSDRGDGAEGGAPVLDRLARGGSGAVSMGEAPRGTEAVVLLRLGAPDDTVPRVMKLRGATLPADVDDGPLVWLGRPPAGESLGLLAALYAGAPDEVRAEIAAAAAVHPVGDEALAFVRRVLGRDPSARVRAEAAFWLRHQPGDAAVALLERTSREDASEDVRQEAVSGLARMRLPAARTALQRLERDAPSPGVRREAGDWLERGADR
ncbi:M56 family metallopeptidase [Longimicrobium terrae]|uniref:Beta-lactamase regulating signal transducer with metallopeptidase domain n=1 Tax=Longimicrobium terrae TaxID=1639882 RepID=A0A841GV53_9BACT|nr:beta-lactamase regulating signal transducer with metallopeptidase domain [Longimicrobium terrae]MBB6069468.1 beta-lactamase regulating signal transducer with metallopeptidase domain [Longimicrobium terrae]NNC31729.1 M48 family metalloprotease [Longimicrobium terrae]